MRVAKNSGYENWQQFTTAEMISVDEWAAGVQGWWPESKQRFKTQALLGTFTSRVTLLEGAGNDEIWGIQAWHGYKKTPSGDMRFVTEKAISFYLPTLHYFNELVFRLLAAEYLAYAGEKTHNGKEYDLLFATWGSFEPNLEHDQYLLWVSKKTRLVDMCLYTVRESRNWVTGTIHFQDYRDVQGVKFPYRHTVVLPWPENTVYPIEENFFHKMTFESVQFDTFPKDLLIVDPAKKIGDVKPAKQS